TVEVDEFRAQAERGARQWDVTLWGIRDGGLIPMAKGTPPGLGSSGPRMMASRSGRGRRFTVRDWVEDRGPSRITSPPRFVPGAPAGHTIPNYPNVARPGWLEPWTPPPSRPGFRYNGPVNHGRWVNPDGTPGVPGNSLWIST